MLAALVVILAALASPPSARAQSDEPIGLYVIDARGSVPIYGEDAGIAAPRGLQATSLPGRGLGIDIGAHVYPIRWKALVIGFGGSLFFSRGSETPEVPEGSTQVPDPTVTTKLSALSPQLSFNFGHRQGWSYISGGIGTATLTVSREDLPEEEGEGTRTINYGGGARWFLNDHVAFSVDLRFYAIRPLEPGPSGFGHPRQTIMVVNVGASFK